MEVFNYAKIAEIARNIDIKSDKDVRNRALFCLLFLTGARIGEVVKRLKKEQIELVKIKGKQFMLVSELYTEKNRKHPLREIPIPIFREDELANYIIEYLGAKKPNEILFDFTIQWSWTIIKKILSKYKQPYKNKFLNACHFLRHCRATNLVTKYDFNDQQLVNFFGWSDSSPASTYSHLRYKDLASKML